MGWLRRQIFRFYGKSEEELRQEVAEQKERIDQRRSDRLELLLRLKDRTENASSDARERRSQGHQSDVR